MQAHPRNSWPDAAATAAATAIAVATAAAAAASTAAATSKATSAAVPLGMGQYNYEDAARLQLAVSHILILLWRH